MHLDPVGHLKVLPDGRRRLSPGKNHAAVATEAAWDAADLPDGHSCWGQFSLYQRL